MARTERYWQGPARATELATERMGFRFQMRIWLIPGRAMVFVIGAVVLSSMAFPAQAAMPAGLVPSPIWGLPFAGMLLSIALLPILAPRFWHRRMAWVAGFWALALLVPIAVVSGIGASARAVWTAELHEHLPFVLLLLALFTAGGGILMRGGPAGTPVGNSIMLAIGTLLAGVMGTTGAAMVLIHPLLRANAHRANKRHLVVFFILLVANIGGATSPLGDPPLYIGFLQGVPFLWPVQNLLGPMALASAILLAVFFALDTYFAAREPPPPAREPFHLRGTFNILLIGVVIAAVLLQGVWHPDTVTLLGESIGLDSLVSMAVFVVVTLISIRFTPRAVRAGNDFTWAPMEEVAVLFAAIFITIGPVMAMLDAGLAGPLAPLLGLTMHADGQFDPVAMFWLTGMLSAFLDNAPTYLVFFHLAGGDAAELTGSLNHVLRAISAGAVFFGALTYIGNAPNMMVRSIAAHRGVKMPGFFVYLGLAGILLLPVFAIVSLVYIR